MRTFLVQAEGQVVAVSTLQEQAAQHKALVARTFMVMLVVLDNKAPLQVVVVD